MRSPSRALASASFLLLTLGATAACDKIRALAGGDAGAASSSDGGAATGPGAGPSPTLGALSAFEGEIDGFLKDSKPGGKTEPLKVFVKSGKVRFEVPADLAVKANPMGAGSIYVIFDSGGKKLYVVMDAQKQALVLDLNEVGKSLGGGGSPFNPGGHTPAAHGPPTKVTKTGRTDTVAGYKCEYWDISTDHKEGTICMGEEGISWLTIPMTGIPTERAWMLELMDGKHFPLRFIGYEKDGTTEETRVEVSKIDKRALADSEFQVPAGYAQVDLATMMGGLMNHPPRGR